MNDTVATTVITGSTIGAVEIAETIPHEEVKTGIQILVALVGLLKMVFNWIATRKQNKEANAKKK